MVNIDVLVVSLCHIMLLNIYFHFNILSLSTHSTIPVNFFWEHKISRVVTQLLYCALGILSIILSQIHWCWWCGDCYKGGGFEELFLAINCRNGLSMQIPCCKVGSMFSTVAISVERYLAVAHPFAKFRWQNLVREGFKKTKKCGKNKAPSSTVQKNLKMHFKHHFWD